MGAPRRIIGSGFPGLGGEERFLGLGARVVGAVATQTAAQVAAQTISRPNLRPNPASVGLTASPATVSATPKLIAPKIPKISARVVAPAPVIDTPAPKPMVVAPAPVIDTPAPKPMVAPSVAVLAPKVVAPVAATLSVLKTAATTPAPVAPKPMAAPVATAVAPKPKVTASFVSPALSLTRRPVTGFAVKTPPKSPLARPAFQKLDVSRFFPKKKTAAKTALSPAAVAALPPVAQAAAKSLTSGTATDAAIFSTPDVANTAAPGQTAVQNAEEKVENAEAQATRSGGSFDPKMLLLIAGAAYLLMGRR